MRYALVVLACLSIAAGQDTIRGSRSDLKEQATVENEKTRNLQNAHHSDGQMRPEAMMAGPKAAIEQLKAGQKEEKTEETKNEISQLKAALKEEKDEIKAMKQELQNEEAQIVGTTGGETYVTDTGEQGKCIDSRFPCTSCTRTNPFLEQTLWTIFLQKTCLTFILVLRQRSHVFKRIWTKCFLPCFVLDLWILTLVLMRL